MNYGLYNLSGTDPALNLTSAQKQKDVIDGLGQLVKWAWPRGVVLKLLIFMND